MCLQHQKGLLWYAKSYIFYNQLIMLPFFPLDICHIRLDFEQFTINNWADDGTGGDAAYVCLDSFVVSDVSCFGKTNPFPRFLIVLL